MRFSRLVVFLFIAVNILLGANCAYYNRVMARKDLVDGSNAYKGRKFPEAKELFREAIARDPNGETVEGRVAQLFLARTLHSEFIGNRSLSFSESELLGEQGLGLIKKIVAKGDPVSQYVNERLRPETIQAYNAYTEHLKKVYDNPQYLDESAEVATAANRPRRYTKDFGTEFRNQFFRLFVEDLNKIINSELSIYDPARFSGVALSEFTKQFMAGQPVGDKLIRLNRLLLEDAFPKEINAKPKAEDAITEYQKALALDPNDQSSYKAIASLFENLQRNDDWLRLVTERSNNNGIPPEQRAEALTSLASKKNTCANEVTDTEATKKTVPKDGKPAFQFVKPANPQDLEKLKQCIDEGMQLIDRAIAIETPMVKGAASMDVKSMSDAELVKNQEHLKVFESARSYKASLLIQAMRLAEMDGRTPDRDRFKTESDAARQQYIALSDVIKKIQAEIDERKKAAEAATAGPGGNKNANANANQK